MSNVSLPSASFEEERHDIYRWVLKLTGRTLLIVAGLIAEVFVFLFSIWMIFPILFGILRLLPSAITSVIGENRLFSKRTSLMLRQKSLWIWFAISAMALIGAQYDPVPLSSIVGGTNAANPANLISLSGVSLLSLLSILYSMSGWWWSQVEVAIPNWARWGLQGGEGMLGETVWNPEIVKKSNGTPFAITNGRNRPVFITMIWFEWFGELPFVTKAFQREYGGISRSTYFRYVFRLDKISILKPNETMIWILNWDEAKHFYDALDKAKVADLTYMAYVHLTIYDDYHDRVYTSRKVALQTLMHAP